MKGLIGQRIFPLQLNKEKSISGKDFDFLRFKKSAMGAWSGGGYG
jgi:hypothetical protein